MTVNYRLGVFGFFGYPGLPNGGAFGLEDQQAALRWVQRNVAAFGGDPRNVTLFGQSAGSHSVCGQLVSPGSAGLFHRAIMQSTPCSTAAFDGAGFRPLLDVPLWIPVAVHEGYGQTLAASVGCADPATAIACLRGKPVRDLLALTPLPLPGYGNAVLPEDPAAVLAEGRFHRVPLMSGITRDEGTLFASVLYGGWNEEQYQTELRRVFGDKAPAVAGHYPSKGNRRSVHARHFAVHCSWGFPRIASRSETLRAGARSRPPGRRPV